MPDRPAAPRAQPGADGKPPTIEMVARHAAVSRQTVSNAFNAPDRLRPETLQRVRAAIDELGYRPNQAARSLRSHSTRVIGCRLLPSNSGGVLDRLLHALCDAARASGYDVLTFSARDDDEEIEVYTDLLRRGAVDGFVLTNTHHLDTRPGWLLEHAARFVAFGRAWGVRRTAHSWVDVDGAKGTSEAVEHLARLGHNRIAFLGVPAGSGVGDDRYRGWERAAEQLSLPVKGLAQRAEDGIESGRTLTRRLLESARPPTGIVCVSDSMAIGALRAIEDRGLSAGRDVSVVGFDDSPIAAVLRPGLSSVRQPIESVAHELIDVLLAELSERGRAPARQLLAPRLVVRESSGPAPGASRPPKARRPLPSHTLETKERKQ